MGFRQKIQENKAVGIGIAIVLVVGAGVLIYLELRSPNTPTLNKSYYTDDDGATTFVDDMYKTAPYTDANGKTAVWAVVYSYAGGSKQYVAYLKRYNVELKKAVDDSLADAAKKGLPPNQAEIFKGMATAFGYEIKAPNKPNDPWVAISDPRANDLMANAMKTPDNSAVVEQVMPIGK